MNQFFSKLAGPFITLGRYLCKFGIALAKGDLFVKLSLLWMGAGYCRRKQYVKSILITLLELAVILFGIFISSQYLPKFGTLGTVKQAAVFNMATMKKEFNNYDNSFMILLYSLISILLLLIFAVIYVRNIVHQYELQQMAGRAY